MRFRAILAILGAVVLSSSCTAFDHTRSIQQLERRLSALSVAEDQQFSVQFEASEAAGPRSEFTPEGVRKRFAEDAKSDMDAATTTFAKATVYDRISSTFRAAIKASKAGEQGGGLVISVRGQGRSLCGQANPRPDRDCGFFEIVQDITQYQIVAARFDGYAIGGRSVVPNYSNLKRAQLEAIVQDLETLRLSFDNLTAARGGQTKQNNADFPVEAPRGTTWPVTGVLHSYIDRERVLAWCHATRANTFLLFFSDDQATLADNEKKMAREFRNQIDAKPDEGDVQKLDEVLKLLFPDPNSRPSAKVLVSSWKHMRDALIADMKLSTAVQAQMDPPLLFCRAYAQKVAVVEAARTGRPHVVSGSRF